MIDFSELRKYAIPPPDTWSCFGSPQNFEALPDEHKEQIWFLNIDASSLVVDYLRNSNMIDGYYPSNYYSQTWQPFPKAYFKSIKKLLFLTGERELKKWLFNCGIPFKKDVFLITDSEFVILTSWKILIKYATQIFADDYAIVFDKSINWCLYKGNGQLYFAENNQLLRASKTESFLVLDSFYIFKIGLLVLIDSGTYKLKRNDILYSNPGALEWIVTSLYNVAEHRMTSFLSTNNHIQNGKKIYLFSPINGTHKPKKDQILFLK